MKKEKLHSIIRVNHAGEFGAKRIYEGQLAILKNQPCGKVIEHMKEQELEHLQKFEELIVERKVRPTILQPFWHIAGFALGAGTALLGEKAAMACTVAVEEVIDEHYKNQLSELDDSEKDLKKSIEKFRAEELEHRDIGLQHDAENAVAYPILTTAIKSASKLAIWLSTRL
jgi:ubiquinone biosynthesis monooxygenase Coq7